MSDLCSSEDTGSVPDEERIRRLFEVCDTNGDGFIDSADLAVICHELNMDDLIDEILIELGADDRGMISYEEFVNRKLALKTDIDIIKGRNKKRRQPEPSISGNSLGELSVSKDKWEFDSGARDLSPVSHLDQFEKAAGDLVKKANAKRLLSVADRFHDAAVKSLSEEIQNLKSKLSEYVTAVDLLKQDRDTVLEQKEELFTEMHSVIMELKKKPTKADTPLPLPSIDEESSEAEERETEETTEENPSGQAQASPSNAEVDKTAASYFNDIIVTELEECRGKIFELESENNYLRASLDQAKEYSESLVLSLGKMESFATIYGAAMDQTYHFIQKVDKLSQMHLVPTPTQRDEFETWKKDIQKQVELFHQMHAILPELAFHTCNTDGSTSALSQSDPKKKEQKAPPSTTVDQDVLRRFKKVNVNEPNNV